MMADIAANEYLEYGKITYTLNNEYNDENTII